MFELKMGVAAKTMGWLDFFSSLVGSLAWPAAAVIIALVFHNQIAGLLSKVRKLNWGGASVELSDKLDDVEDKSRAIEVDAMGAEGQVAPVLTEAPAPGDRFQALLAISPAAAILDAWAPVDRQLTYLGKSVYGNEAKFLVPRKVAERLANDGHISPSVVQVVNDLQRIRNDAAHARDVTVTDALRFDALAHQVMSLLAPHDPRSQPWDMPDPSA